jgi:GWxTD domain-containing protein
MFILLVIPPQDERALYSVSLLNESRIQIKVGRYAEATGLLIRGLENLANAPYADTLFQEMKGLLSATEKKDYSTAPDKGLFLLNFWMRNDPEPSSNVNTAYIQYCLRQNYIRQQYSTVERDLYDDRGAVFLRYGPPQYGVSIPGNGKTRESACWVYILNGREITFEFIRSGGMFRRTDHLTDAWQGRGIPEDREILAMMVPRRQLGAAWRSLWEGCRELEPGQETPAGSGSRMKRSPLLRRLDAFYRENSRRIDMLPRWIPAADTLMRQAGEIHAVRFSRENYIRTEIGFILAAGSAGYVSLYEADQPLSVTWFWLDPDGRVVRQGGTEIPPGRMVFREGEGWIGQVNDSPEPGNYILSVVLKQPAWREPLASRKWFDIPDDTGTGLRISDIQMAFQLAGKQEPLADSSMAKGDLWILPNPGKRIAPGEPSAFYFELKNLTPGQSGDTQYHIEYHIRSETAGMVRKISPFAGKETSISSSYRKIGSDRQEQEYIFVQRDRLRHGYYAIEITVTDLLSGSRCSAIEHFYVTGE